MTEREFEAFHSNLQLLSYAVMISVLILLPFIVGAVLKAKNCGATRKQLIVLCISSCVLSIGLPHLAVYLYIYSAIGIKPTSEILFGIIQWANPLYAVPASVVAYIILKKTVMYDYETEEYKLQAARNTAKELEEDPNSNEKHPWYTVGTDLSAGDVTVIRTAEPAFINVDKAGKTYRISLMYKKEYIVVRDGEKYRPFNCYFKGITPPKYEQPKTSGKIDEVYILPEVSEQTTEASTEEMKDFNDMPDIKPSSSADDNPSQIVSNGEPKADEEKNIARQAIDDYINEKKEHRKKIIKFAAPFVAFALVCVAIVAGIAHYYSTTYSDNLRAQLRDEVWHEAFNAGYDAARK